MDRLVATPRGAPAAPSYGASQSHNAAASQSQMSHPSATPAGSYYPQQQYQAGGGYAPAAGVNTPYGGDYPASLATPGLMSASMDLGDREPLSASSVAGNIFRASPVARRSASSTHRTQYKEETYTPLRFDRSGLFPSPVIEGTEALLPSPAHLGAFNGGITYATPIIRRKEKDGDSTGEAGGKPPSYQAGDAVSQRHGMMEMQPHPGSDGAPSSTPHHHVYHRYDGPPSPSVAREGGPAESAPAYQGYHPGYGPPPPHGGAYGAPPHYGHHPQYHPHGPPQHYGYHPAQYGMYGHPPPMPPSSGAAKKRKATGQGRRGGASTGTGGRVGGFGATSSAGDKDKRRKKMYSDYVGVTYNKTHQKYQACITHYRKQHYLGRYRLAVDAARAYDESAKLLKGSGWKINFGSVEEYEIAKKNELERMEEDEKQASKSPGLSESVGKKKSVSARVLADQPVRVQVPQSVFTVIAQANGREAAAAAQAQVQAANEAAIRSHAKRKLEAMEKAEHARAAADTNESAAATGAEAPPSAAEGAADGSPSTTDPDEDQMPPLPSNPNLNPTPKPDTSAALSTVTPSPFQLVGAGSSAGADVVCTPSQGTGAGKAGHDKIGGDSAASAVESTPLSELRPTKIIGAASDASSKAEGTDSIPDLPAMPSMNARQVTPAEDGGDAEAKNADAVTASVSPKTPTNQAAATTTPGAATVTTAVTPQTAAKGEAGAVPAGSEGEAANALMTLIGH